MCGRAPNRTNNKIRAARVRENEIEVANPLTRGEGHVRLIGPAASLPHELIPSVEDLLTQSSNVNRLLTRP